MPALPLAAWAVLALLGVGTVAVLARRPSSGLLLKPAPLKLRPELVPDVVLSRFGTAVDLGYRMITAAPRIPATVLASVASRLVYAGPWDDKLPQLQQWAQDRQAAEANRGNIVSAAWQAMASGVDGLTYTNSNWGGQHNLFNAMAVMIQDALDGNQAPPPAWVAGQMQVQDPRYASVRDLRPSAQLLVYRYYQVVNGIGCDTWDQVWVQGHTTREIFSRKYNKYAIGENEQQCRDAQRARGASMSDLFLKLGTDPAYTQDHFERDASELLLELAKRKIVAWPGGPAVSPSVDWGWVIGALVRMFVAGSTGNYQEYGAIAAEAEQKAKEAAADPSKDYGSAEMIEDLKNYAGSLASRALS